MRERERLIPKKLLYYGEIKATAIHYGIDVRRAQDIIRGTIQYSDAERDFVMHCYDLAAPRKRDRDKLRQLAA